MVSVYKAREMIKGGQNKSNAVKYNRKLMKQEEQLKS